MAMSLQLHAIILRGVPVPQLELGRTSAPCLLRRRQLPAVVASSRNPGHPRAPLWKGRILSNEAMRLVRELKRARTNGNVPEVLKSKFARLLKPDMVAVLNELQRQDECELSLKVFDIVRMEYWYKPDESLFSELIVSLGRNNLIAEVDRMYSIAKEEGVQSTGRLPTEVINAQLAAGNIKKAMEVYNELKELGFFPCESAYGALRKGLETNGEIELLATVEQEYKEANGVGMVDQKVLI